MSDNRIAALRAANTSLGKVLPLLREKDVTVDQLREALAETVSATVWLVDWALSTEEQARE